VNADVDVLIVGGGAAGVGAARALSGRGLNTVLLEASSRLGGRAWTERLHGQDLDLGCGWLHSAERNAWRQMAEAANVPIDRSRAAWGKQYRGLGFSQAEQDAATREMEQWVHRLKHEAPSSDCAADALEPAATWNDYLRTIVYFISGAPLERLSAADYVAYDEDSSENNWRVPTGYGALIAASLPAEAAVHLGTPVEKLALESRGVAASTTSGVLRARAVILTVSTEVLAGDSIQLPSSLDAWREAARQLPLGHDEKLFLEITGVAPFERESQVIGNPRDRRSGAYYIRPFDRPVIECFLGGESSDVLTDEGPPAAFAFALEQLVALFGAEVRALLRPMVASSWSRMDRIGGAYSYALPRHADARVTLARPFEQRIFFAGEATSRADFSTAHGAHDSGVRAAREVLAALGITAHTSAA
jgi:monoamine oxidase